MNNFFEVENTNLQYFFIVFNLSEINILNLYRPLVSWLVRFRSLKRMTLKSKFALRDFHVTSRPGNTFDQFSVRRTGKRDVRRNGGRRHTNRRSGGSCAHARGVGYIVEWMSFIPSGAVHIVSAVWRGHHPLSGIVYFLDRDLAVMYGCGFARYASHTRPSVR